MNTQPYVNMILLALFVNLLQLVVEASEVHLVHDNNFVTPLVIVFVKFNISIFTVFKMLELYGKSLNMIFAIVLSEGSGFLGHTFVFVMHFISLTKKASA